MFMKLNLTKLILGACIASTTFAKKAKVYTKCNQPGQIVLTFDDGPNPDTTPIALEILDKYKIKATFFINGKNYGDLDEDPESVAIVKKAYAAGHDIGSHTYFHKDLFSALEDDTLKENIDDMASKIESIIGVKPAYFRPPSGNGGYEESDPRRKEMNDLIQEYLGERGYSIIMWGTDTRDWEYKENVDKVIENLNQQLADPNVSFKTHSFITLLHDVHPTTVNIVLEAVIEYIKSLGYNFVSLSECIGVSPYQSVSGDVNHNLNNNSTSTENNNSTNTSSENSANPSPQNNDTNSNSDINNAITNGNTTNTTGNKDASSNATTLHYSILFTVFAILISLFL